MSKPIVFGEIDGISEGQYFENRLELMNFGVHRLLQGGIDGNPSEGAAAIVLSGGYVDDVDYGHEILYTGAGGQNDKKIQVSDQSWNHPGNAALLKSMNLGIPIRVIRGYKHKSDYSPKTGYIYAGLYSLIEAFEDIGKNGFKICRFKLIYSGIDNYILPGFNNLLLDKESLYNQNLPQRGQLTILRIIRDTKIGRFIKKLYDFKCQVCSTSLIVKDGFYAEGAHIRPLGFPHNGKDNLGNILCLCPNHHIMFDRGSFSIKSNYNLVGKIEGKLFVHHEHNLDFNNLEYHSQIHGY